MKVTTKSINKNWYILILTVIVSLLSVSVFMIVSDISHTSELGNRFDKYVRYEMKTIVQTEVESRIDEIEYDISVLIEDSKSDLRTKISIFEKVLLNSPINDEDIDENLKRDKLIKYYEDLVSSDTNYLYFVLSPDGILYSTEADDSSDGKNMMNYSDRDGVFFVREMTEVVDAPEGKYVTYRWAKEKGGEALKKTSFCKYIPSLDIIIGAGYYEEDIEKTLKEQTFSRLQSYYENTEDYVFVVDYDGIAHVFGNKSMVGNDIRGILDYNGDPLHTQFMNTVAETGEGFTTYNYYKKGSDILSEKTSFIKAIDRWDVYIGMGFHTDDLNQEILKNKTEFNKYHFNEMFITVALLTITAIIVFILIKRGRRLQTLLVRREEVVFEQLFHISSEGILIVSKDGKVLHHNLIVDKLFGNEVRKYISDKGDLELINIKDNTYFISTHLERIYYINYRREELVYHDEDSYLYFISDITEQYLETHKLEQQALHDELTTLPNRRKLMNDYEDLLDSPDLANVVVAIIDLDDFKNINDTHGHDIGDEVLKLLADSFLNRLRECDFIYRYGGEEFVILFKEIDIHDAKKVLLSIKTNFSELIRRELGFKMTFSGGAVDVKLNEEAVLSFDESIKEADILLYQAKSSGRNNIKI